MEKLEHVVAFSYIMRINKILAQVGKIVVHLFRGLMDPLNDQLFSQQGSNGVRPKSVVTSSKAVPIM